MDEAPKRSEAERACAASDPLGIRPEDIHSLTEFQRQTREFMERLREAKRPEVLTVNGRAAVVVQEAAAYQDLVEQLLQARRDLAELRSARTGQEEVA